MKNLNPYLNDGFAFYEEALAGKSSVELRDRLAEISEVIEESYENYQEHFHSNDLEGLQANALCTPYKPQLLSLYNYQSGFINRLKHTIERQQPQAIRYTCQHCTLTSNESLDHFVPKDEFPEFAINPFNLIPSCSKCNQHKSSNWRNNGTRTALNLYLDTLPDEQYLFVDANFDEYGDLTFEFYLKNYGQIEDGLFELIEAHYDSLNLFKRMRQSANAVISELQNSIISRLPQLPYITIAEQIKESAEANRTVFGRNYWKSIVELELIDSPPFLQTIGIRI
jgi:5-methylcytosine-specific restriction endonuclease McrA